MDEVKKNLKIEMTAQYNNLIQFLNKIPMHEKLKEHCFQNLDQGIMWCEKGIDSLILNTTPPQQEENQDKLEISPAPSEMITSE